MSPDERLLSVAEIARRLGVPESTVHYWKNRFAQHLPSVGAGRQKRFRPEAVEIFRAIAEMFSLGHSASDVMDELGKRFPLTAHVADAPDAPGLDAPFRPHPEAGQTAPQPQGAELAALADTALRMAAVVAKEMGQEIARSIGEGLGRITLSAAQAAPEGAAGLPPAPQELAAIKDAVEQSCGRMDAADGELARLTTENADLKAKLSVLEAELVRLRKDRREMEKYLLDKMKSMST